MITLLVDENLPRSLAPRLRAAGLLVQDVRDIGFRGSPDREIFQFAILQGLVLLTGDLGFGALFRSQPGSAGLILARLPSEWPVLRVNDVIERALVPLLESYTPGSLIVIEPDRVRVRKLWQAR